MSEKEYFCERIRECEGSMYSLAYSILKNEADAAMRCRNPSLYPNMSTSGDESYAGLHITHETLRSTPEWFTLQLTVSESAASSSSTIRIYHIDRLSGSYVTFGDLFDSKALDALEQLVLAEMAAQMAADASVSYWEEGVDAEPGFAALDGDQNFYFAENGDLVIIYDEFEVAPGYMGSPAFVIAAEDCTALVAPQYADLF